MPSTSEPGARPRSPEQRPRRCVGRDQISRDECRAGVRWVRRNFSNRRPEAGADGEEAADGRKMRWRPGRASRVGIGTQYNARHAGGAEPMSGGATILFDRPRARALRDCIRAFWCLRWIRAMMMLSARSRMNLVFLSGEPPRVLGHYLASILVGCDGGVCKP